MSRINFDGTILFNDLNKDPEVFQGAGDYQFDIYRIMREDVNSDWSEYAPVTNIRWLHYLLDKILQEGRYNNTKTKTHKKFLKQLENIYYIVQDFQSATELAQFFCTTYIDTMSFLGIA